MRPVTRRRLLSIVALVMLLASLFSTETAEVWCRVATGATIEADDDDGPYFTCRAHAGAARVGGPTASSPATARQSGGHASVSAAFSNASIVDEPTFSLPQLDLIVLPAVFGRVVAPTKAVTRTAATGSPPLWAGRFVRPPPRAPPLS